MDSRIKRTATALAVASALALPGVASAGDVKTAVSEGLTIKGFVIASLYYQDADFGFSNGQAAQWPTRERQDTIGGDVRNTRLTLGFNGPEADSFKFGGTVEVDFFGGYNGAGAFSDEQQILRLRLAYVDVTRGKTTFRIGQAWSPMFGYVPASPTHVAFPLGYGTGKIGWRFPGLFVYHDFGGGDNLKTKLTLAAMRGSWNTAGQNLGDNGAGESGVPQLEARLDLTGKNWSAFIVGHYDSKDCGFAESQTPPIPATAVCPGIGSNDDSLDGTAVQVGAKVKLGAFSLQGQVYTGTAIGQQFGNLTQFGDVSSTGGWIQGSFQFTPKWAGHLYYGMDDPDDDDLVAAGLTGAKNEQIAASVMYSTGPYVFGVEWLNATRTNLSNLTIEPPTKTDVDGNQVSFSVWYKF